MALWGWCVWFAAPNSVKIPDFRDGNSVSLSSERSNDLGVCDYTLVDIVECEMESIKTLPPFIKSPGHDWRKPCFLLSLA